MPRRILRPACLLVVSLLAGVRSVRAQDEIFVTNFNNSVTVYARTANGNVAPVRSFSGGLTNPQGIAIDLAHDEVFVVNFTVPSSIAVYPRSSTGVTTPLRVISGAATELSQPIGLALDIVNDEIIVANRGDNSIKVFPRTANGNVGPIRRIIGDTTGLGTPFAVALDLVNNELAVTVNDSAVRVFARTADGNVAPLRTIKGPSTGLKNAQGIAVDTLDNEIAVANENDFTGNTITAYSRMANGDAAPLRTIAGPATGLAHPRGLTIDIEHDELIVPNSFTSASSVAVFARTAFGNAAPLRTIAGAATGLNSPAFTAVPASAPTGLKYYTVNPCRVVDTRGPAGPDGGPALDGGGNRVFPIGGHCGVPVGARSVALNLTVVGAGAVGDLRVYAPGLSLPLISTIDYHSGPARANNAILSPDSAGEITVHCDQTVGTTVQLVIDVNGYFR
jgi:hypothetical protein